jgi:two-component system, OmpR family, aerobic respiration control sensor histidine kinase ArcB
MQTNIKVLLVEDNLIAQKVAEMILTVLGCKVQLAVDGEQALEMFKANKYHFIFMDLGLPGISGLDTTREIRKLEINTAPVPIVALTANYDSASTAICLQAGMDDFLLKPLSKEKASTILTKFFPGV